MQNWKKANLVDYPKNAEFVDYYKKGLISAVSFLEAEKFAVLAELILKARDSNGTVYIMGNGGSASIAAHFAHNLNWDASAKLEDRKRLKALALHENLCHLTGLANDRHYDQIFVEQLRNFLQRNDIVIGISASGNADNVFNALKYAKERNFTVSLSGNDGGKIAKVANLSWVVPSYDQQIIEDVMQIICHVIVRTIFYRKQGFIKNHLKFADIAILREKEAYLASRGNG